MFCRAQEAHRKRTGIVRLPERHDPLPDTCGFLQERLLGAADLRDYPDASE